MGFSALLDSFAGKRAVVLGDVMLDEYVFGTIDRISPEAPVMVVRKRRMEHVPGGAANVAKNVAALGGTATVIGIVGEDESGKRFQSSLQEGSGIEYRVLSSPHRVTTCKTRIIANHSHQVLRIDEETVEDLGDEDQARLIDFVRGALAEADVLVMSDYRKGVLTESLVREVIRLAREASVPVVVNAKPGSARFFSGAELMTLNKSEAEALGEAVIGSVSDAVSVAKRAGEVCGVKCPVVTLGDKGMVAVWEGQEAVVPAPEVEAYDVAGAGDTALATLALGLAAKGLDSAIFELAVQTSAKVVQHVGVAVPGPGDLASIRALG